MSLSRNILDTGLLVCHNCLDLMPSHIIITGRVFHIGNNSKVQELTTFLGELRKYLKEDLILHTAFVSSRISIGVENLGKLV